MESTCVAVPLKPGMWESSRQYRDELVNSLNHPDVEYAKKRGFKVVKVFRQTTPMEALILYFEADDLKEVFHPKHQADATSAKWTANWAKSAGLTAPLLSEFPQLLLDWHHEEGHRHKAPLSDTKS